MDPLTCECFNEESDTIELNQYHKCTKEIKNDDADDASRKQNNVAVNNKDDASGKIKNDDVDDADDTSGKIKNDDVTSGENIVAHVIVKVPLTAADARARVKMNKLARTDAAAGRGKGKINSEALKHAAKQAQACKEAKAAKQKMARQAASQTEASKQGSRNKN